MSTNHPKKQHRGFAAMPRETLLRICSKGGKRAHELGRAHELSSEEARAAGRKGGLVTSRDLEHMAAIGKIGGSRKKL